MTCVSGYIALQIADLSDPSCWKDLGLRPVGHLHPVGLRPVELRHPVSLDDP
jgi:hypothetical protein